MKRRILIGLVGFFFVLVIAGRSSAATVLEFTAGTASTLSPLYPGQLVKTPAGGPWNNLVFNWFDPGGTPAAFGTLFLLGAQYFGTPAALSASTPGFLAQSQSTAGGFYTFAAGETLQPNTQYLFYSNASGSLRASSPIDLYPDGAAYFTPSNSSSFVGGSLTDDLNFRISGVVAVPESETYATMVAGLGLTGFWVRRRMQKFGMLVRLR